MRTVRTISNIFHNANAQNFFVPKKKSELNTTLERVSGTTFFRILRDNSAISYTSKEELCQFVELKVK
jgi:hypothetical protein